MANRMYHTLLAASTATGFSAAIGYPATNAITTPVDKQYRTTGTSASEYLILDLGSSKAISAVGINHCNFATASMFADNAANPSTARGTLTTYVDHQGRRKGSLEFSATARYIKFQMPGSGTTDGASYFFFGFAAPFASAIDLPRDMLFGLPLDHRTPQIAVQLANGQEVVVDTGAAYTEIAAKFAPRASDDIEQVKRLARAGVVWLNLNLTGQEYRQWPVKSTAPASRRTIERPNREPVDLPLREQA